MSLLPGSVDRVEGVIFVVSQSASVREVLKQLLDQVGYRVICFADGSALLAEIRMRTPNCILLDVDESCGVRLALLGKLRKFRSFIPAIVISSKANIPAAVEAIRNGAADFIAKPLKEEDLLRVVADAMGTTSGYDKSPARHLIAEDFPGSDGMTRREIEVLSDLVHGATAKESAARLGLGCRTVEEYRGTIKRKLGVKATTDLVRMVLGGMGSEPGNSRATLYAQKPIDMVTGQATS
jgi:FixJ family two-component response regulator